MREDSDGPKFGCARVRPISEGFSPDELQEHTPRVIERVKKHIIMLLAGAAATKLILGRQNDPLAQHDQSHILGLLREFPELQDAATIEELSNAADEAAVTRRAQIETVAGGLVERISLNADQVRQLVGN